MRSGAPLCAALLLTGCPDDGETEPPPSEAVFEIVHSRLSGALLSVWGTSENDVWTVGGDARDGTGPNVFHYDGSSWEQKMTGIAQGNLWWVYGFAGGPIYMGGEGGLILRYEGGTFTQMTTPDTRTVFGIWGATPEDMWAVGGQLGDTAGFAWRLSGDSWVPEPSLPAADVADAAIWKVFGTATDDAWLVGSKGRGFHWDGTALTAGNTGAMASIFTVHANAQRYAAVGGLASGFILENDGSGWALASDSPNGMTGVCLAADDTGYAVGVFGTVYAREAGAWHSVDHGLSVQEDLHGVWLDPAGGVWAVGGRIGTDKTDGILIHKGEKVVEGGL
ncbi:MAG TPA: hypothetical protein VFB62_26235 [Polyangiaceae bacterium]|jgi:hypothetical protein|nr:hypothetical protein [Polyangiaceae bacterium]